MLKKQFEWIKRKIRNQLARFIRWFSNRIKSPRLWKKEEWESLTALEKSFIWYKHILFIRGVGSGEIDQVTDPFKELILYGGIILSNVSIAFLYLGIELNYFSIVLIVAISCIILWVINFLFQVKLGNWKDVHDLVALEQEIGNKRNIVFREIRENSKNKPFRKNL